MYDVPKEYRAAIRSPTRKDRMAGKLTLTDGSTIELTDSAVIAGSVSVDNQCVSGQELAFGSVYMGQASLQLRTALSSAAFYDAALQIDYEIQLADGSWYTLPVGRYTVAEAERSAAVVSLTGYDNMLKLERKFSGSAILGDAYTMLTQIASTCGVELAQSEAEIKALSPNAEILRQLDGSYRVSTWRDCVGAIAQLLAGFATIDRLGRLRIVQFGETPCVTLSENARTNAKISDFSCHYAALVIETDTDTFTSDIEGESGLEMTISDMPLAESGTAEVRQGICDAVFARLRALDYTPAAVTMPGDPASDFGSTATLEQDAALTLTVRYYLDNVLIDSFTPAQRLVRGAHALALFYPFPDLEGAASHRWSVRLLCAGGGVKIAKGQIRATITGQGMAVGDAWDGTLELEELVGRPTRTPVARKVLAIQDVILAGTQKPIGDAAAEIITRLLRKAPARTIL